MALIIKLFGIHKNPGLILNLLSVVNFTLQTRIWWHVKMTEIKCVCVCVGVWTRWVATTGNSSAYSVVVVVVQCSMLFWFFKISFQLCFWWLFNYDRKRCYDKWIEINLIWWVDAFNKTTHCHHTVERR